MNDRNATPAGYAVDAAVALAAGVLAAGGTVGANNGQPPDPIGFVLIAVAAAPLALRRRLPLLALAVSMTALWTYLFLDQPWGPVVALPALAVLFLAAAWHTGRTVAVLAPLVLLVAVLYQFTSGHDRNPSLTAMIALAWIGVPAVGGALLREAARARARARDAERERHRADERVAMAREIHDVVGHSLAVVSMNAGVALHTLDKRTDADPGVVEHLRAIRDASTRALDDLRTTLVPLRQGRQPELRPAFDLDALASLVEDVRKGGLGVEWRLSGDTAAVPARVGATAYRVVQEALTNVIRHAEATTATARIVCGPHALTVEVSDDGRGGALDPDRQGQGVTGMMERVQAHGGALRAGPAPGRGFTVHADIPYAHRA